ncbi:MAG: hypothetical protein ACK4RX_09625 [Chitinophagaceae bacterium]|jgi:hypothetical protein
MQLSTSGLTRKAGILCAFLIAILSSYETKAQKGYEFTSFTVIESIIPSGIGRSRIIHALEPRDYKEFTSVRTEDDNTRNKSDRDEIRVKNFAETKILNFFNMGGIRFQNIAANDAVVNSKVNAMMEEGWDLMTIVAGVESDAGEKDGQGIFITRFYFKRPKK